MWKATLATLVLATSTAAFAQPAPYEDTRNYNDPIYEQRRYDLGGQRMRVRRRAITLAENVVLMGGRYQRPTYIPFDARWGDISRLRLDLQAGRTYVDSVEVLYADGHREVLPVRQMLSQRDRSITIALPHGGIRGLFISSTQMRAGRGGGWRRMNRATVNVIGLRPRTPRF